MNEIRIAPFGEVLEALRKRRGLSQQELATKLDVHRNTIGKWERGICLPDSKALVLELARQLHLDAPDARRLLEASLTVVSSIWHVPFRRNPLFTGREETLRCLHEGFHADKISRFLSSRALTGLGGVGKTQIALEYAYRYREDYQAVLWVRAETYEILLSDLVALAEPLYLSERHEQEQQRVLEAVKRWLGNHGGWLLILDNIEEVALIADLLPSADQGHLLLTTRSQATGSIAHHINVVEMEPDEGALLVLRRAKRLEPTAGMAEAEASERDCALEIARLMGGLPLALDQAAAYLEETACSLPHYLRTYQAQRAVLLSLRGAESTDHPLPVSATFALALARVERTNPAAAELLRFCTFLHPNAIPKDLIMAAVPLLGSTLQLLAADPLILDTAIGVLRRFSLLNCHPKTELLSVHRLVQAVLQDSMDEETRRCWAERTVQALNRTFPDAQGPEVWPLCQRYLPHVLACRDLIDQWPIPWEIASRLLSLAGVYLMVRRQHEQAEPLLLQAHQIRLQSAGPDHPERAASLHNLGELRFYQGKHAQAAELFQQALVILEQHFPAYHFAVLESMSCLATTYQDQGHYGEAALLFRRLLLVSEHAYGPFHLKVADVLHRMAAVLRQMGSYDEALSRLTRALSIYEQTRGTMCEAVAFCHEQLGLLFRDCNQDETALQHFQRSLAIREHLYGPDEVRTARSLYQLGLHYRQSGRYCEALPLLTRALSIRQRMLGPTHVLTAISLQGLGLYHLDQGKWSEAESFLQRSLVMLEQALSIQHPQVGKATFYLARVFAAQGQYTQAEELYQKALATLEQALGEEHADLIPCIQGYAELLRHIHCLRQARFYEARARKIMLAHAGQLPGSAGDKSEGNSGRSPSFKTFLAECCEMHVQARSRAADLWQAYERWRENQKEEASLSRRAFARQLMAYGCYADRTRNSRLWRGIAVKPGWEHKQGDANS